MREEWAQALLMALAQALLMTLAPALLMTLAPDSLFVRARDFATALVQDLHRQPSSFAFANPFRTFAFADSTVLGTR